MKRLVVNKFASYKPFNDELKDLGYLRLQINKEIKELEDLLNKANNDFIKTPKRGMKVLKGLEIQEKIKKGTALDESDKKALFELRDVVFKCKLGDKKYEEFKKLIEKKKCGDKLTEEEEEKLKCYFKELK